MIKIIISGPSDGFYARYASDEVLNDEISQHLLDRRRYLSTDGNRLFKEGYSFQPLADKGILFHKIILLYDGFGRNGFMMASLFLPIGEMLKGKDIKDALDTVINDYKLRTSNGIANIETDWSFVKQEADKLNNKVQPIFWKKRPLSNLSSKTALIKGAEDRVADYFEYPNPLHRACENFEQVFLTESLLDPAMTSNDGEQGYKVLTTADVDIDNPEYIIEYKNRLDGAQLSGERNKITKKELILGIPLGTYSKLGYRPKEVTIPAGAKSLDGFTISVELPDLAPKEATVVFQIFDRNTELPITPSNIKISWPNNNSLYPPKNGGGLSFRFEKEQCDGMWHYVVQSGAYQDYEGYISVQDGKYQSENIQLMPKPLWNIYIQMPDGQKKPFRNGISDADLSRQIAAAKSYLKGNGWDAEEAEQRNDNTHEIVVKGKKAQQYGAGAYSGTRQATLPAIGTTIDNVNEIKSHYYLYLDPFSKNFSLFKNYSEKCKLKEEISNCIKQLEDLEKEIGNTRKSKLKEIITALKEGDADKTKVLWRNWYYDDKETTFFSNDLGKRIASETKNAIKSLRRRKQIPKPNVVKRPKDVRYNPQEHRLECERVECPDQNEEIVLGADKYKYIIDQGSINWTPDSKFHSNSPVKRTIQNKYKILYGFVGIVALLICAVLFKTPFLGNGMKVEDLKSKTKNWITQVKKDYPQSYCTDSIFNIGDTLNKDWKDATQKDEELKNDSTYMEFVPVFKRQEGFRQNDSVTFERAKVCIDQGNFEGYHNLDTTVLTQEHKATLDSLEKEKASEIESQKALQEQKELYDKCMGDNGTVSSCEQFLQKYPNSIYQDSILLRKEELLKRWELKLFKKCFENHATASTCDKYLKDSNFEYFKTNQPEHVEAVKKRKEVLSQNAQPARPEPQPAQTSRLEQDGIKTLADLFEALGDVEYVMQGSGKFQSKYKFTNPDNATQLRERANAIISVATGTTGKQNGKSYKTKKSDYSTWYTKAANEATYTKKFQKLEDLLK